MSLPSSEAVPPVSDATPPVPPASPPQEQQKRPLLRQSSVIDLTQAATEGEGDNAAAEPEAKRARDQSFKPVIEDGKRALVRQVLTEIAGKHQQLAAFMGELCPEKNGEFVREVEMMFSLSFSETFCAIASAVKSK